MATVAARARGLQTVLSVRRTQASRCLSPNALDGERAAIPAARNAGGVPSPSRASPATSARSTDDEGRYAEKARDRQGAVGLRRRLSEAGLKA